MPSPVLTTANPFVGADEDQYRTLADAARLNEARVRELIALANDAMECGDVTIVGEKLRALAFGLGALLPPVNIRIRVPLAAAKSLSGRRNAA